MSKKIKYHFNPESLSFERIEKNALDWLKSFLLHAFTGLSMGLLFFFIYFTFFGTPEEKRLKNENERLQGQYKILDMQTKRIKSVLVDLQERDDNLYRAILQAEPIPEQVREGTFSGTNRYESFKNMRNADLLIYSTQQVDQLSKRVYAQSKSYDDLMDRAKNNELRLLCIPAIQPILNKNMTSMASGYGRRIDPIYHVPTFHAGMDFSAHIGTKVFATGEGHVNYAGWKQGYGNTIQINHGYNYETLYGHLSEIDVRIGEKVKRGDVIGKVGDTGKSTGPHLHYEVHYRGEPQNPSNYYYKDLSPAEYDRMVQMSSNFGQTMD